MLQFEAVSERGFGPWAMAHVGTEPAPSKAYAAMAVAADFDPSRCSGVKLFQKLRGTLVGEERSLSPAGDRPFRPDGAARAQRPA